MKPSPIKYYFLIFALLSSTPLQAAWYQVEVILFEYLEPDADGELWYDDPGLPPKEDAVELITESAARIKNAVNRKQDRAGVEENIQGNDSDLIPYQILSGEKYRLRNDYLALKLSKNYRPLLHIAWQQPGEDSSAAKPVHIGINRLKKMEDKGSAEREGLEDDDGTPPRLVMDGTVRLRSTRYLHADVDFAFFPDSLIQRRDAMAKNTGTPEYRQRNAGEATPIFVEQQADYVRLMESRKIKLNELHYFDHPLFGVLLQVSRIKE